ncbi:hypothetical protein GCM10009619_46520 [Williamsia maris]|uniref:Acyl-CoA synthetase (AMP-forming)/AMP-acid ligase II n=1 Tax=Williamsia maris TaxID=72806 RepID=A0ABT1HKQ1_9NOCA|nr:Acyl-CoA synthetase (AMP-forming)/AMP-acid ligase II [Williamsia maris]
MHAFVRPDGVALVTESATVTSAQLYARIEQALPVIADLGGTGRRPVAVEMDGSIESVIAAIAVLMSSVPLVPVDRHQPQSRRALISELTGAIVLDHRELFIAPAPTEPRWSPPGPGPIADPDPDEVAMILMTSGSTGTPKGVMLSHRMCLGKAYDVIGPLVLAQTDRLGNVLPLGFGAGINTLTAGLLAGVPVMCRDPRSTDPAALRQWLRDSGVTTLHCSAALGRALATAGVSAAAVSTVLPELRVVVYYGEPLSGSDLRTTRAGLAPRATVVNWYACTECGVVAFRSFAPEDEVPDGRLAAGRAVRGRRIMIVDAQGRPVEPGGIGEIWIRGGDFAVGYLGEVALPTTRTADGEQWYRTGDRGRVDDERVLHVIGRLGSAVKIRGYLVEPGEVESALRRVSGVVDAHVTGVEFEGHTELVAHVALDAPVNGPADARSVRALVRRDLPDWMVPRFVESYDRIPRTDRGKIDRERLRAPASPRDAVAGSTSPLRTSDLTVLGVADMVRDVMGRNDIGVDDDLIELGADSLALTTILARVTANFHVRVDVARVAAAPTIATVASMVRDEVAADARTRAGLSVLVPLRSGGDRTPLFIVAGAGAPAVSLIPTARHLAPDRPVFGLQAWGLENRGRPDRTVAAAARRNIEAIGDVAPRGPYLLAGHSMGAHVAWEMAAQLRERGHDVAAVILIDPHLSEPMLADLRGGAVSAPADGVTESALHTGEALDIGLRRLVAVRLKMMVAGLVQFEPLTQWLLFYNLGMATLGRHRPRPLDVPAAVLRTSDNPHGRAHWSLLARGPLHIDSVPGGHTDLLREPSVSSVAAAVDTAITELGAG